MARGRKTNPITAATVRVMAEMGFEAGLIGELLKLPRATTVDIIRARGSWSHQVDNELMLTVKHRVKQAVEVSAYDLATMALDRLKEKMEKASFMELISACDVLVRVVGGKRDEQG